MNSLKWHQLRRIRQYQKVQLTNCDIQDVDMTQDGCWCFNLTGSRGNRVWVRRDTGASATIAGAAGAKFNVQT